jgi:hypothetical protein
MLNHDLESRVARNIKDILYFVKDNIADKSLAAVLYIQTSKVQLHLLIYDFIFAVFT